LRKIWDRLFYNRDLYAGGIVIALVCGLFLGVCVYFADKQVEEAQVKISACVANGGHRFHTDDNSTGCIEP